VIVRLRAERIFASQRLKLLAMKSWRELDLGQRRSAHRRRILPARGGERRKRQRK
jgi:hypothetical protein